MPANETDCAGPIAKPWLVPQQIWLLYYPTEEESDTATNRFIYAVCAVGGVVAAMYAVFAMSALYWK